MPVAALSVIRLKKRASRREARIRYIRSRLRMRRSVGGAKNGPALPEIFWQPLAKSRTRLAYSEVALREDEFTGEDVRPDDRHGRPHAAHGRPVAGVAEQRDAPLGEAVDVDLGDGVEVRGVGLLQGLEGGRGLPAHPGEAFPSGHRWPGSCGAPA